MSDKAIKGLIKSVSFFARFVSEKFDMFPPVFFKSRPYF